MTAELMGLQRFVNPYSALNVEIGTTSSGGLRQRASRHAAPRRILVPMTADMERLRTALAGRYTIQREVGHGGAAVVYLAQDEKYGRSVALKVLRPEVAGALGPERFLREIRITARLQHPHILPLLEAGEADGLLFYVMPYVEGHSLRVRLARERQLPIHEAAGIARDVAGALACAHDHDVLHRDIKPENILLSGDQAVVADFGIARAMTVASSGDPTTGTGLAVGTPAYMSPEQAEGARNLTGRSDIYSLGCVLYEMLVGEPPFTGASGQAVIARHAIEPVPPVRTVRPTVSVGLELLIGRTLAKAAADRFATAAELAEALAAYAGSTLPRATPVPVGPPAAPSIVVLPFVNLSPDPENEYFSDGLSEELMSALCKVAALRVAARTSAFAFKGRDVDVRTIGRQLNVDAVLSGSVRKAGNRLRITAQLVHVADGYLLWSEQYDRELGDVFAIQDDITGAIVHVLKLTLLGDERARLARRASGGVETYELYLQGRYFLNKRTEPGFDKAIEYFQQALFHDPRYAPALAGLADCYALLGIYGVRAPHQVMPLAKDAAAKALSLDPSLAEAHVSLGCVRAMFDCDWPGAEREFQRAIELNASYPTAHHWYALNCLTPLGRFDEARAHMQTARELDPLSPVITTSMGVQHYFARRYEQAIGDYQLTLELDERFAMAHYFLALALAQLGRHDEALARLRQAITLTGGTAEMRAVLGYVLARAGQQRDAQAALAELLELRKQRYVSASLLALVHVGLGDDERAVALLEEAHRERAADLAWLNVRPVFDALRGEPRVQALLRAMNLAG